MFSFARADARGADAAELLAAMAAELSGLYGGKDGTFGFRPEDVIGPGCAFLIGYAEGRAVACGALRPLVEDFAEVKRMFVRPEYRGRGYSRALLGELERLAVEWGFGGIRLETGDLQPEAIRLYETAGYGRIDAYGEVEALPPAVCFEKRF